MNMTIRWQRLVDAEGRTCDRCGGTQEEVRRAREILDEALAPVGLRVVLEEGSISPQACIQDVMESNRIWIADRPLEEWLGAQVGASPCGSCCEQLGQTVDCRTTVLGDQTYEVIPAEMIVRAGLMAAASVLAPQGAATGVAPCAAPCAAPSATPGKVPSQSACCPSSPPRGGSCCPGAGSSGGGK